jgi:hypothetical protein
MALTLETVNTGVSETSPYRGFLRSTDFSLQPSIPIGFSAQPSIPNWIDDIANALSLSSVQVVTFSQNTRIPDPDRDLSLKYALIAEMTATRDGFVLRSGDLDEDAFGLTYEEAYLGFLTSLRDRYDSLLRREASLSRQDHSVLERLRRLLAQG